MKSTKSKNRIKAFAVSVTVCLALILGTVFTFGYGGKPVSAAGEARAADDGDGIRFVQVAAGDDFAIGLTYDGRLFGWSLTGNSTQSTSATSLGGYYTAVPTEINVKFREGPGGSANRDWTNDSDSYHKVRDDKITSIAATRTTAAFITASGYIYTWGRDGNKDIAGGYTSVGIGGSPSEFHYLLLRPYESPDAPDANWYTPYIVDYNYYEAPDPAGLDSAFPKGTTFSDMSIAGGENNYIMVYKSQSQYYSYVWGSILYVNTHVIGIDYTEKYNFLVDASSSIFKVADNKQSYRNVYRTQYVSGALSSGIQITDGGSVTAVAGGYNVGMNASSLPGSTENITSLTLRGKNFLTSVGMTIDADGKIIKPVATVKANEKNYGQLGSEFRDFVTDGLSDLKYSQKGSSDIYTVEDAVIGAYYSPNPADGVISTDVNKADLYYARQAATEASSTTYVYGVAQVNSTEQTKNSSGISGSSGNLLDGTPVIRNAVSLGNDIGYGISDGKLYAWGDNTLGQSGLGKGEDKKYYQYPQRTLEDKGVFVSVAAGKQTSPDASHKAFSSAETLGTADGTDIPFAEGFQNGTQFISGAVTADGKLYVWNDVDTEPKEITFGNAAAAGTYNGFTAVYSGYNRNIFAITKLGKLVRITCDDSGEYEQTVYDSFREIAGSGVADVTNWSVESADIKSAKKSVVRFEIPEQPNKENLNPAIGDITLFVNNALPTKTSVSLNGIKATATEDETPVMNPMTYAGRARDSLVSTNKTGDVYRILAEGDEKIEFLSNTNTVYTDGGINNAKLTADDIKPKFSFKAKGETEFTDMEEEQWSKLFSYNIIKDGTYGVGIKITPARSTRNGVVNVSFYVARYDCAKNPDTAVYYDYSKCNVEFTVDNSEVVRMYDAFDVNNGSKSAVPLLDPGNESNKYYSLAVQDVSSGFTALASFISQQNADELVERIIAYITDKKGDSLSAPTLNWDPGFPDKEKVKTGNLKYYLGANAERLWYSGSYKYLFKDRDLDVVKLRNINSSSTSNTNVVAGAKTVIVKLTGLASGENALANKIAYTDDLVTKINKEFENVYGLVDISVKPGDGDASGYVDEITFSYDVLLFTANGTTGRLDYGDEATVDSFNTVNDTTKNIVLSYSFGYDEYITGTSDFTAKIAGAVDSDKNGSRTPWQNAAAVFSQASVRLKDEFKTDGKLIYGAARDNLALDIIANNHLDVADNSTRYVGSPDVVIRLTDYVQSPGDYISFSVKNNRVDFKPFDSQFVDSVSGEEYVKLSGNTITVKFLSAHDINFTVTIQRFFGSGSPATSYFKNGDERVTISFSFTGIKSVPFTETAASTSYDISREMKIYMFGPDDAPDAEKGNIANNAALVNLSSQYRSHMKLTNLSSGDYSVVTPKRISDSAISVTPGESGKATVQFTLTAFDVSIPITLSFNVSGITTIKDVEQSGNNIDYTVNLSDVERVYINTLTTGLQNVVGKFVNNFDKFGVLYDDKKEVDGKTQFAGVYFERVGASAQDGETEGEPGLDTYLPPFVKNISFYDTGTDKAYLRFDIDSDATADELKGEYLVYVKFVDTSKGYKTYAEAENDTVLRARFKLKANKKVAFVNGAILEIVADVDKPKKEGTDKGSDWYMTGENTDAKIYVPLRYLCNLVDIDNYDEYEIYLVSMAEGAAKYINPVGGTAATRDALEITPIYSTKSAITLNVSICNTSKGASENQVVAFNISIKGISTTLSKDDYTMIWLVAFFGSLGFLMIIFLIRMIIYWRRRAKQRALIKRNQELIKMRDRVHNKATSATREQAIRTKLKLQDPKYAKMLNDVKKDQNGGIGVATVGDDFGVGAAAVSTGKKSKKKKGGKKSMAELKAELAAKKAAFAQAQSGAADPMTFGAQPVNPFGDAPADGFGAPGGFGAPNDFGAQGGFDASGADFGSPADMFSSSDLDGNSIIFDAPDNDGGQG